MADSAPDFIPDGQMPSGAGGGMPDAHTPPASSAAAHPPQSSPDFIPEDAFVSDEDRYSEPGEQVKAGLEGVAKGLVGPLAPLAETKMLGVKPEDIRGREAANPITQGVGQAVGLGAGMFTGTGEASVLEHAGQAASDLAGLSEATTFGSKVGSAAVKSAAEMAVLQGGDEIAKQIVQDPDASAQSAIANIGLAAALGAGTGAFITGAVSPLWKATVGNKVDEFLTGLKGHLNGESKLQPSPAVLQSMQELGMNPSPLLRSALSGDPKAIQMFNELREAQHPEIIAALKELPTKLSQQVSESLGAPLEDMAHFSQADAGHELLDTFKKEYDEKYAPIAAKLEERNKIASTISLPDEARRDFGGQLMEKAISAVGTDSPYYKTYEHYAQRVMARENIGALDQLRTEIARKASTLGLDQNEKFALQDIRKMIGDFQESQIEKQSAALEAEGAEHAKAIGRDIVNERKATAQEYAKFRGMSEALSDHLGTGNFYGAGTFKEKLGDLSPEQLVSKFSPKGNVDSIPFLQEHFPETLNKVRENEMKKFVSPAVYSHQGEYNLDIKKLSTSIERGLKGSPEYVKFALPEQTMAKIQAAKTITDAIPGIKSSGTAGWMTKMYKHVPAAAMSALGFLMGHNPIAGYMIGEVGERLGRNAPDAIKLGLLKFLGSEEPVKAEGFKAMVDFIHNTAKGQSTLSKGTEALFKSGAEVLGVKAMPAKADRDKLDKIVTKIQNNPDKMAQLSNGQTGHYMGQHQVALTQATTQSIQYLQSLKPRPIQNSPLDRPVDPSPAQIARYNRALDIANQPAIVLQHIKDGTLQATDIQDLGAMYPAYAQQMVQKVSNAMTNHLGEGGSIPYTTRMGLSLLLGQPLDQSMQPQSIIAAQPLPKPDASQQPTGNLKKSTKTLGSKTNAMYRTASQAAEQDRSDRS